MAKTQWLERFIKAEQLPDSYASLALDHFLPLAKHLIPIINARRADGAPFVLGINGAQGTGKTTFAKLLIGYWTEICELNGSQISLDDFYLTREERKARADKVHALFATRGVPGTHDVDLAINILTRLKVLRDGEVLSLPRFDKALDDRRPEAAWPKALDAQDFIIFEGWCVGARPVSESELEMPINRLEAEQDREGLWRRVVNQNLAGNYQRLWSLIDRLVFLKAPDFETVLNWRIKQERHLARISGPDASHMMSDREVAKFIQFYERITKESLKTLTEAADYLFEFDRKHGVVVG